MKNPLRSEDEAFRFLIAVILAALVIAGAAWINTWLGVAAAVVAASGLVWWLRGEPVPGARDRPRKVIAPTPPGTRRVLVVALPGTQTAPEVDGATEVVVVVPAISNTVESLTGAVDDRRADAQRTAETLAGRLPNARAEVGADDPALAVEDALREFGADEIVVVGDDALVQQVRGRTAVPVRQA